ncbi:MAG: hypothetical protein SGJ05_00035 [bacterium]|nr:hypothetical protein [bacterium]
MKPEVPSQSKKKKRLSIDPATVSQKLYERDLAAAGYERTGDLFIIDPYKGGYINMTARYREARVFNKEKRRLKLLQKNSAAENSKPAAKKSKPAAKKSKPAAKKSKPAAKN